MNDINIGLLIDLFRCQSKSGDESRIRGFILDYLNKKYGSKKSTVSFEVDSYGNILITKGTTEVYPCVIAHMDTVHPILPKGEEIEIRYEYEGNIVYGINSTTGANVGLGGDDKCGVHFCLNALEHFDNIKIGIFVEEEIGCHGSYNARAGFFNDVGYFIQFDAPFDYWISHYCNDVKLFHEDGEFFNTIKPNLEEFMPGYDLQKHPYTDVLPMRERFGMQAINFSIGYHRMHSRDEFVDIEEFNRLSKMGIKIIEDLGEKKYPFNIDKIEEVDILEKN